MTMTFTGDALTSWTTHLQSRHLSARTVSAYAAWVARLSRWADADPLTLTRTDLERWVAAHGHWSPNTHQKACQAVRYFYRWAADTGLIDADPAATLRPCSVPRPISHPCPESVYRDALDHATGQDYWRLRLAADTGLRRSELAAVTSADVHDLVTGPTLHVLGKGRKQRWVPLPADLAGWLQLQRGPVFTISAAGVGKWYSRHLGIHVHTLRHRYATRAYHASHDIEAVAALMGHSSVTTTQMYIAIAGDELTAAARGAWDAA